MRSILPKFGPISTQTICVFAHLSASDIQQRVDAQTLRAGLVLDAAVQRVVNGGRPVIGRRHSVEWGQKDQDPWDWRL